jgi:hypothetical protein
MTEKFAPIELKGLTTYSIADRKSKVSVNDFASPWHAGGRFKDFLGALPDILAGRDLCSVIDAVTRARRQDSTVLFGMGGHVIKVGLNPLVIDLMERGVISAVAMNGAGIIHDLEIAMAGKTSEDVAAALGDGTFGMAREPATFLCNAIENARRHHLGLGRAVGQAIVDAGLAHAGQSILAAGARLGIPVTVHVAMGTDILHMHPDFNPAAAGAASHRDFRTFASVVGTLDKGVYLNVGSAVILPEVFLKATTLVRNQGHPLADFTTVNMDFIQHYRPLTNVVRRPTADGGQGFNLTGHHEIMLPLIAAGVIEGIEAETG